MFARQALNPDLLFVAIQRRRGAFGKFDQVAGVAGPRVLELTGRLEPFQAKLANRLAPDSPEAARALGLAQLRAGDGEAAVDTLRRAQRLFRQRDRLTDLILALAYDEAGKPNTARREYTQACKLLDQTREHSAVISQMRSSVVRTSRTNRTVRPAVRI